MIIIDIMQCQSFFDRIDAIRQLGYGFAMVTAAQCRAARALLDWSQQGLADRAGVGIVTVRQLEGGDTQPRRATLEVIRRAFESAGVEFIDENGGGPGLRLRKRQQKKG